MLEDPLVDDPVLQRRRKRPLLRAMEIALQSLGPGTSPGLSTRGTMTMTRLDPGEDDVEEEGISGQGLQRLGGSSSVWIGLNVLVGDHGERGDAV